MGTQCCQPLHVHILQNITLGQGRDFMRALAPVCVGEDGL